MDFNPQEIVNAKYKGKTPDEIEVIEFTQKKTHNDKVSEFRTKMYRLNSITPLSVNWQNWDIDYG